MGNIFDCCRKVSAIINSKGVMRQTEEQSLLLLSMENSDIESLSPSRTSADLLASPVLDQDHLLFPDIVLSSNLRVKGNSLQPLELLSSTRRQSRDARRDYGVDESNLQNEGERNKELLELPSTNQLCSIEDEWPLLSSLHKIPAAQNRICTRGRGADTCKSLLGHGTGLFTDSQTSVSGPVSIPVLAASSLDATQSDVDILHKEPKVQLGVNVIHTEERQDGKLVNEHCTNSSAQTHLDVMKMQPVYGIPTEDPLLLKMQREAQTLEPIAQPDTEQYPPTSETLEVDIITRQCANEKATTTAELLFCVEKKMAHVEQPNITEISFGPVEHELGEMEQSRTQTDQDFIWKNTDVEQMQRDLEALKQRTGLSLRNSEQTTLAVTQVEQKEDQSERFTLFVIDKLFLATPNFTGVYSV